MVQTLFVAGWVSVLIGLVKLAPVLVEQHRTGKASARSFFSAIGFLAMGAAFWILNSGFAELIRHATW